MYRKQMMKDLQAIFGIKKVVFSSVEYGEEQDVLYVDIETQKNRPQRGKYYFRITGNLGINSQAQNTVKGFFHAQYLNSRYENRNRLGLSGFERNVNFAIMNKLFCKSRVNFVYTISIDYNPARKTKGFIAKFYKLFKRGN